MKILNRSFFLNVVIVIAIHVAAYEHLVGIVEAAEPDRKPSSVVECNKGDARACRELKRSLMLSVKNSQLDPETTAILRKIISQWKADGK